jgi:CRISPR/Cas system-associated endoribonuclease Cas2
MYDISNGDRRNNVFKTLRDHGDRIQYSVFRCDPSDDERIALIAALHRLIEHPEDQIVRLVPSMRGGRLHHGDRQEILRSGTYRRGDLASTMIVDNCIAQRSSGDSSGQVRRSVRSTLDTFKLLKSHAFRPTH